MDPYPILLDLIRVVYHRLNFHPSPFYWSQSSNIVTNWKNTLFEPLNFFCNIGMFFCVILFKYYLWRGCFIKSMISYGIVNGHYGSGINRLIKLFLRLFTGEVQRCKASSFSTSYITFILPSLCVFFWENLFLWS